MQSLTMHQECQLKVIPLQLTALKAVLELARAGAGRAFEPYLFCAVLETIVCSIHASEEFLGVLCTNFADFIDIRYTPFLAASDQSGAQASMKIIETRSIVSEL